MPSPFHIHKHRADRDRAGQRAEAERILEPGFKSSSTPDMDGGDSSSVAGPSRLRAPRTAGGLANGERNKGGVGLGIHPSQSMSKLQNGGRTSTDNRGGVYLDSNGKIHDTEFDPFAGVSKMSRAKSSKRRSAFSPSPRKMSGSSSSSMSGSDDGGSQDQRTSMDGSTSRMTDGRDDEEQRIKSEIERRRQDEVSSYTAAKRRSMMSDRSSQGGRATPSVRSGSEDGLGLATAQSAVLDRLGVPSRSRSSHGQYISSPLSPIFGQSASAAPTTSSLAGIGRYPSDTIEESPPQKTTQVASSYLSPHHRKEKTPVSVSVNNKKITVTGFDAPVTPVTPQVPTSAAAAGTGKSTRPSGGDTLKVPDSGRRSASPSRQSIDSARPRMPDRAPEDIFPEKPAQMKRREDRERRARSSGAGGLASRVGSLAIDTSLSQRSALRILPEIEIVEDDDPRIIFPESGKSTRVQTKHDHVIRGPFSHALQAQGLGVGAVTGSILGRQTSLDQAGGASGSRAGSTILDENGGYLPSRWATGDRELRKTEDEKEKYRPREWGGRNGDAHGGSEEWQ